MDRGAHEGQTDAKKCMEMAFVNINIIYCTCTGLWEMK